MWSLLNTEVGVSMIVYRVIKYEGPPDELKRQLDKSIMPNKAYKMGNTTVHIKDMEDCPVPPHFFNSCEQFSMGFITREQYNKLTEKNSKFIKELS